MTGHSTGKHELDDLVSQPGKLGRHDYAQLISAAEKNRGDKARAASVEIVNDNLQMNLESANWKPSCSECGSADYVKREKRNGLQRYVCSECGRRFTTTSGTLLERSNYMWDVWVKVVSDLVNLVGIDVTFKSLHDDYGCVKIHRETVWLMRMKVLYAIWSMSPPKLHGTIQMDDTFFREDQKGTLAVDLVNPLLKSTNVERKPRYGSHPSLLGSLGPEFASVTCVYQLDQQPAWTPGRFHRGQATWSGYLTTCLSTLLCSSASRTGGRKA